MRHRLLVPASPLTGFFTVAVVLALAVPRGRAGLVEAPRVSTARADEKALAV